MPLSALKSALASTGNLLNKARRAKTLQPSPLAAPAVTDAPPAVLLLLQEALDGLKAEHLTTVPLVGKTSIADWLLIATGTSSRHLSSLADRVQDTLAAHGTPILGREGDGTSDWICVDAGDVIIHLFLPDARKLYNLEKLWSFPAA